MECVFLDKDIQFKNNTAVALGFFDGIHLGHRKLIETMKEQAKEKGHDVKVGKFSFKAIGKALVYGESDGFVKIIADKATNDILGVHMIGPHVTDMISEAGLAMVLDATPWEIAETIHPHPTLSEVMGEAALAVDGKAIHS